MIDKHELRNFDYAIALSVLAIFAFGLFSQYSASFQKGILLQKNFALMQIVWLALGTLCTLAVVSVSYRKFADLVYPLYGLSVFLLLLVLIFGKTTYGAKRWLDFGIMALQPSEFAKISFILVLAKSFSQINARTYRMRDLIFPSLVTFFPMILILKQPDLGTALVFIAVFCAMAFIWGIRRRHMMAFVGVCIISSPIMWSFLKGYQKKRLMVFLNPNADPLGAGYTVIQSKIAVGSGGLFGKGWLAGSQNQLNFLPEHHTDFIFSVVGEEWGFFGAALLLFLYFIIIMRGIYIVEKTNDSFGRLLACGIVAMLSFQVVVNIAMTIGMMPVVGIPLVLISYGGSSMLATMISIGLLLNVGMRKPVF